MSGSPSVQPALSSSVSPAKGHRQDTPDLGTAVAAENSVGSGNVSIRSMVSPVSSNQWKSIYDSDPAAVPSLSPEWARCVVEVGGYRDVSCHFEFADGVQAVLPLFESRIRLGPLAVRRSPPSAWGFGGFLSTAPLTANHIRAALARLQREPGALVQIRPNPLDAGLWNEAAPEGWTALARNAHVLDLNGGYDEVWGSRFKSDTRNRVRRAERAGLEIECGSHAGLVEEFHALLVHSFGRWAKKQHEPAAIARWRGVRRDPLSKFLTIAAGAPSIFKLWIARADGKAVAAILVLRDHQAHYTRGAMIEELAGPSHANYLLHAKAIEDACRAGCRHYHMGETGGSRSLAQFKSRFGAEAVPYAEYQYERLPVAWASRSAKAIVKRIIGFKDV